MKEKLFIIFISKEGKTGMLDYEDDDLTFFKTVQDFIDKGIGFGAFKGHMLMNFPAKPTPPLPKE